jgi:hypothetical protein
MYEHPDQLLSIAHERNRRMRADAAKHRLRGATARARARFGQHRATGDPAG